MTRLPPGQLAFSMPETVQSVVKCRSNGPLLAAAAQLWIDAEDLVVDVTYGRGNFWTHYRPAQLVAHDLALDGVDFRHLPEADRSVDVVVFDPPQIQGGRDMSTIPDFVDCCGLRHGPTSQGDLENLIAAGITEAARVLRPGGRLLVKCMDYVNSAAQFISGRHHVVTVALSAGLELVDELVHYSGCGRQPDVNLDGTPRGQEHARRAHSFLCVFRTRARRSGAQIVVLNGGAVNARDAAERRWGQGERPLKCEPSSAAPLTPVVPTPEASSVCPVVALHCRESGHEDARADLRSHADRATLDRTVPPRRGRRPLK